MLAVDLLDQAIAKLENLLGTASHQATPITSVKPSSTPVTAPAPLTEATKEPKKEVKKGSENPSESVDTTLFDKALLKVAKVLTVAELPNSDKLYKLTVDVGNNEIKQVCAGLKQFLTVQQLQDTLVTVVLNLKPAKLAGELSEAMIMAADSHATDRSVLVCTLMPPTGSQPGDVVFLEGSVPSQSPAKQVKSDDWKKIVAALSVQGSRATFAGKPLVTSHGHIMLPEVIPDGAGIH